MYNFLLISIVLVGIIKSLRIVIFKKGEDIVSLPPKILK